MHRWIVTPLLLWVSISVCAKCVWCQTEIKIVRQKFWIENIGCQTTVRVSSNCVRHFSHTLLCMPWEKVPGVLLYLLQYKNRCSIIFSANFAGCFSILTGGGRVRNAGLPVITGNTLLTVSYEYCRRAPSDFGCPRGSRVQPRQGSDSSRRARDTAATMLDHSRHRDESATKTV